MAICAEGLGYFGEVCEIFFTFIIALLSPPGKVKSFILSILPPRVFKELPAPSISSFAVAALRDKKEPPIVDVDKDKDKKPNEKEDDDVIEPEIKEINITQENANTYLISNWQAQEDFSIKTIFNSATWTQIKVPIYFLI